jgi:hypothetical protein
MENKILFRASSIGHLMTDSRTKNEILGKTAKSYIEKLFKENEFGYVESISSKYLDKGIQMEDVGIQMASEVLGWDFVVKNTERFNNDFITGEPDILTDNLLADIKCSWNLGTFPMWDIEITNKMYYWQMQSYMMLTGHDTSELVYCLMNTPFEIVEDEVRREHWKLHLIDEDLNVREAVQLSHNFDQIPNELRIKRFIVQKDEEAQAKIIERVKAARQYYEQLKTILS